MTDFQLLTLAIAVIVPLSLLIYSNSRITDTKETLRAEMREMETRLSGRLDKLEGKFDAMNSRLDTHFERLETMLKIQELEHHSKG
jgi:hypothetical protein